MAAAHGAFHRVIETLEGVAAGDSQVLDRRLLAWAQMIGAWLGPVNRLRHTHHGRFLDVCLCGRRREKRLDVFPHQVHDLGIAERHQIMRRRHHELETRFALVVVVRGGVPQVSVDRNDAVGRKKDVVNMADLAVGPQVHRDDRHAFQLGQALEVVIALPGWGHQLLQVVNGQRGDVIIGLETRGGWIQGSFARHASAARRVPRDFHAADGAVGLGLNVGDPGAGQDLGAAGLDILGQRAGQMLFWRALEKAHVAGIVLTQEKTADIEHDAGADVFGFEEFKRQGHGQEHLAQHAVGNTNAAMPFLISQAILRRIVFFTAKENRRQSLHQCCLFAQAEVLVLENGRQEMQGRRQRHRTKLETLTLIERVCQDVIFPQNAIIRADIAHQVKNFLVSPEKDMQPGLDPVAIGILPGRPLAAQHIPFFQDNHLMTGFDQALGGSQPGQPAANHEYARACSHPGAFLQHRLHYLASRTVF